MRNSENFAYHHDKCQISIQEGYLICNASLEGSVVVHRPLSTKNRSSVVSRLYIQPIQNLSPFPSPSRGFMI